MSLAPTSCSLNTIQRGCKTSWTDGLWGEAGGGGSGQTPPRPNPPPPSSLLSIRGCNAHAN